MKKFHSGGATDELKLVPTGIYGPLKRAEDAIAVLLARGASYNKFIHLGDSQSVKRLPV
jgi:hypothetical protein